MRMKDISLLSVLTEMWKKKVIVIAIIVVCTILGALMGYLSSKKAAAFAESEEMLEYNAALEEYESSIAEVRENIATLEEQIKDRNEYIENSIYMKVDPNSICTYSVDYTLVVGEGVSLGNVMSSLITYINDGKLRDDVASKIDGLDTEFLKEVLTCYNTNNTLSVNLIHYDDSMATAIMDEVKTNLIAQNANISSIHGTYRLELQRDVLYRNADLGVLGKQDSVRNDLKNYKNSLADNQTKAVNLETAKDKYAKDNLPSGASLRSPAKTIILYAIFGFAVGFIVILAYEFIKYIISDRIYSADDMKILGIPVLAEIMKDEYTSEIAMASMVITTAASSKNCDSVKFWRVASDDRCTAIEKSLCEELSAKGVVLTGLDTQSGSIEDIQALNDAKGCITVVRVGQSTYNDIAKLIETCRALECRIYGCLVVKG